MQRKVEGSGEVLEPACECLVEGPNVEVRQQETRTIPGRRKFNVTE